MTDYFKRIEQAQIMINEALDRNDEVEMMRLMDAVYDKTQLSNLWVNKYLKGKEKIGLIEIKGEFVKKVRG